METISIETTPLTMSTLYQCVQSSLSGVSSAFFSHGTAMRVAHSFHHEIPVSFLHELRYLTLEAVAHHQTITPATMGFRSSPSLVVVLEFAIVALPSTARLR